MGRSKKHNACATCLRPSYGVLCEECRARFRRETRLANYRGSHRMIICPGCGGQMHKNAKLCVNCYKGARRGELVIVTCDTCGAEFGTVKDWSISSSKHRGLWQDKPDRFYCTEDCYSKKPKEVAICH